MEAGASSYAFSSLLFPSWEAAKSAATFAVLLSLLALSPMLGGDGVGVDELGIIIIIILLLLVLTFGSLSQSIVIILFPFTIPVVIILISLLDIVERGSYVDAQS